MKCKIPLPEIELKAAIPLRVSITVTLNRYVCMSMDDRVYLVTLADFNRQWSRKRNIFAEDKRVSILMSVININILS